MCCFFRILSVYYQNMRILSEYDNIIRCCFFRIKSVYYQNIKSYHINIRILSGAAFSLEYYQNIIRCCFFILSEYQNIIRCCFLQPVPISFHITLIASVRCSQCQQIFITNIYLATRIQITNIYIIFNTFLSGPIICV